MKPFEVEMNPILVFFTSDVLQSNSGRLTYPGIQRFKENINLCLFEAERGFLKSGKLEASGGGRKAQFVKG